MEGTVSAIVPAAGAGERLAGDEPKQLRLLGDMPVLAWSVRSLAAADGVAEVIVGAAKDRIEQVRKLLDATVPFDCKVVAGGTERQDTVRRCLAEVRADAEIIVIHDAVRPFVSPELVEKVIRAATQMGAATACVRPSDSIKLENAAGRIGENLDRERLWQVQTPQAFKKEVIIEAHNQAVENGFKATDDTALVERTGAPVEIVRGERLNFKITTDADWETASALVAAGAVRPARI
jgi:2-C-methyl-D-erythritol 4-phosphate cytidylyltransferase